MTIEATADRESDPLAIGPDCVVRGPAPERFEVPVGAFLRHVTLQWPSLHTRIVSDAAGALNPVAWSHLGGLAECDVIHCLQPRTYVTDLAMLFGRLKGKRTFLTDLSGAQAKSLARFIPMRNMMTGFLPISDFNRQLNAAITRPATVIGGGVDTDVFCPDAAVTKERHLFSYVGRIFEGKGLHLLIDALPPGATLDVIGGFSDDAYRRRVEQLAAGKPVRLRGRLPDADVVATYRKSVASVLPSLFDTGFTSSMESIHPARTV